MDAISSGILMSLLGGFISLLLGGVATLVLFYPIIKRFLGREWPEFRLEFDRVDQRLHALEIDVARSVSRLEGVERQLDRLMERRG